MRHNKASDSSIGKQSSAPQMGQNRLLVKVLLGVGNHLAKKPIRQEARACQNDLGSGHIVAGVLTTALAPPSESVTVMVTVKARTLVYICMPIIAKPGVCVTLIPLLEVPSPQSTLTDKFEPSAGALGSVSVTVPNIKMNCWPGRKCKRRAVRTKGKSSATCEVATALLPP